jgi:hypothetical protein
MVIVVHGDRTVIVVHGDRTVNVVHGDRTARRSQQQYTQQQQQRNTNHDGELYMVHAEYRYAKNSRINDHARKSLHDSNMCTHLHRFSAHLMHRFRIWILACVCMPASCSRSQYADSANSILLNFLVRIDIYFEKNIDPDQIFDPDIKNYFSMSGSILTRKIQQDRSKS